MLILLKHDLCFCFFFAIHSIHLSIALAQSTLAAITETTESVADKKYKLISHSSGGQQFQDQGTSTRSHSNGSSSLVHSLCRRGQRAPRDLFHKGGNPIQEVATLMTKALSKTHPAHTHCPPPIMSYRALSFQHMNLRGGWSQTLEKQLHLSPCIKSPKSENSLWLSKNLNI